MEIGFVCRKHDGGNHILCKDYNYYMCTLLYVYMYIMWFYRVGFGEHLQIGAGSL